MSRGEILNTFQQFYSPNESIRNAAQEAIEHFSLNESFPISLIEVLLDQGCDLALRQFAGVLLKRYIELHWCKLDRCFVEPETSPATKQLVRQSILTAIVDPVSRIQTAASVAVAGIARWDWPDEWPDLISTLAAMLQNGDSAHVTGVIRCLDVIMADISDIQVRHVLNSFHDPLREIFMAPGTPSDVKARIIRIMGNLLEVMAAFLAVYDDMERVISTVLSAWTPLICGILCQPDLADTAPGASAARASLMIAALESECPDVVIQPLADIFRACVAGLEAVTRPYTGLVDDGMTQLYDNEGVSVGPSAVVGETLALILDCFARPSIGPAVYPELGRVLQAIPWFIQYSDEDEDEGIVGLVTPSASVRGLALDLLLDLVDMEDNLPIAKLVDDVVTTANQLNNWRLAEAGLQVAAVTETPVPMATLEALMAESNPPVLRGTALQALSVVDSDSTVAVALSWLSSANQVLAANGLIVLSSVADGLPSRTIQAIAPTAIPALLQSPVSVLFPTGMFAVLKAIGRASPRDMFENASTIVPMLLDAVVADGDPALLEGLVGLANLAAHSPGGIGVLTSVVPVLVPAIAREYGEEQQSAPALVVAEAFLSAEGELPRQVLDAVLPAVLVQLGRLRHDIPAIDAAVAVLIRLVTRSTTASLQPHFPSLAAAIQAMMEAEGKISAAVCPLVNALLGHHFELTRDVFVQALLPTLVRCLVTRSVGTQRHVMVVALIIVRHGVQAALGLLGNALDPVLTAWLKGHADFNGDLDLKISATALCALIQAMPSTPALQVDLPTRLKPTTGRIITRSLARRGVALETWEPMPFVAKAVQLLLDVYREELEQLGGELGELDQEDGVAVISPEARDPLVTDMPLARKSTGDVVREGLAVVMGPEVRHACMGELTGQDLKLLDTVCG
ncbi:Importin-9 [Carpediemonas membranifera]|uniref:Importin-9 n=1 Tax=Carpediemonas membranifera TaxID=201153 RepID=A0A8J6AVH9_9EUKA|nr:Importin-9 [Carpediemonas membranifera]|eukprot:KAG9395233.1 Importin-9 [Carpediemonas membranifera]